MDTRDNQFKYMTDEDADKDYMIPFDIDEQVEIKGYVFKVHRVDIDANVLILKPVGTPKLSHETLRSQMDDLAAKMAATDRGNETNGRNNQSGKE